MGKKDNKKATQKKRLKAKDTHQSDKTRKKIKKILEDDEEDLDAILCNFRKQIEARTVTTEEVSKSPPSCRLYASLTANPINSGELFLFGGEFYDGKRCCFYSDLYRYVIDKKEWRKIHCPASPGPRSSHQMVASPVGHLYLFGGEFSSSKESQFYHYKDFWRFDINAKKWDRIEAKPSPPARSGHRMALWRNLIVLFGGFYDTYLETKYYDDLWVFDTRTQKWTKIELAHQRPSPRSGCLFLPYDEGIFLYGGYVKKVLQHGKSKGIVLSDAYLLKMNASSDIRAIKWEKVKVNGFPSKEQSGMSGISYKNKAYIFGGVHDCVPEADGGDRGLKGAERNSESEDEEDSNQSEYFNDLLVYHFHSRKCYSANIKKSILQEVLRNELLAKKSTKEEEDLRYELDLMNIEAEDDTYEAVCKVSKDETMDLSDLSTPKIVSQIHPRYNAMVAVQRNDLFIYGGKFERGEREFTLDDMYRIPVEKLNGYECLQYSKMEDQQWLYSDQEEDNSVDESGIDTDTDTDVSCEDERQDGGDRDGTEKGLDSDDMEHLSNDSKETDTESKEKAADYLDGSVIIPMRSEKLRDYYERTKSHWNLKAVKRAQTSGERIRDKALKTNGFLLCKVAYEEHAQEALLAASSVKEEAIDKVTARKIR